MSLTLRFTNFYSAHRDLTRRAAQDSITPVAEWLRLAPSLAPGTTFALRFQAGRTLHFYPARRRNLLSLSPSARYRRTRRPGPTRGGGPLAQQSA
jgi:hypothetical protein